MLDHLDHLVCISLSVHIWSGRKKLRPADLNLKSGEIPPDELASLGAKKICDPEELKTFHSLRRRAERLCEVAGVRFLGGYAVPLDKAEELTNELKRLAAEFEAEKERFLSDYGESTTCWLNSLPAQWRPMVAQAIEPLEHIAGRLSFAHQCFQARGVDGLDGGLNRSVDGLGARLLREISRAAAQTWEASFKGRTKVGRKALRPIRAILEKAKGLLFLENSLAPVLADIEEELDKLPQTGSLDGCHYRQLVGILTTLAALDGLQHPVELVPESLEESDDDPATTDDDGLQVVASAALPMTWF